MVFRVIGRFFSSIISVCLSWVWAVQFSGFIGSVVPSLDDLATTTTMIWAITIALSLIALFLIWSGIMNLSKIRGVAVTRGVISGYFVTLIALTLGYMTSLGDIKYVMLGEVAGAWVIWFAILAALANIKKNILAAENAQVEDIKEAKRPKVVENK